MSPEEKYKAEYQAAGGVAVMNCTEDEYVQTAQRDEAGGVIEFSDMGKGSASIPSLHANLDKATAAAKAGGNVGEKYRAEYQAAAGSGEGMICSEDEYVRSRLTDDAGGQL